MSDIEPIDSKKTQLSVTDIAAVAAHTDKKVIARFKTSSKKSGASAERIAYSFFMHEMQDPSLVRIREGNTLFTVKAVAKDGGYLRVYNGDVKANVLPNYKLAMDAAHKMGFNYVVAPTTSEEVCQNLKILSQKEGSGFAFGVAPNKEAVVLRLGKSKEAA